MLGRGAAADAVAAPDVAWPAADGAALRGNFQPVRRRASNPPVGRIVHRLRMSITGKSSDAGRIALLTAVENGGAGPVSRRSKMAAHNRAVLREVRIGAIAPITPPFRERHRGAQRHGDLERASA